MTEEEALNGKIDSEIKYEATCDMIRTSKRDRDDLYTQKAYYRKLIGDLSSQKWMVKNAIERCEQIQRNHSIMEREMDELSQECLRVFEPTDVGKINIRNAYDDNIVLLKQDLEKVRGELDSCLRAIVQNEVDAEYSISNINSRIFALDAEIVGYELEKKKYDTLAQQYSYELEQFMLY